VSLKRGLLGAIILTSPLFAYAKPKAHKHSITVKFDYDFRLTPACASDATKISDDKKNCVKEFVVYDISIGIGNRTRLASLPAPSGASDLVKGISFTTPSLRFASGKHIIAVVARTPNGEESDPSKCTTTLKLP